MLYNETPLIRLKNELTVKAGITLCLKREDLNHPQISGNKWWKLKYNLKQAVQENHSKVLTFGGAYSNHLFATAAAASELSLKSIGMVRGEESRPLNSTLSFAQNNGMELRFISREGYRQKNEIEFIQNLKNEFGDFYLIPEGGTNALAVQGCEEWADQLHKNIEFDYLCLPVGTGGTIAGMINKLSGKEIIGFSALKGGDFLVDEIKPLLTREASNWKIETRYHFGGYAKVKTELTDFITAFESTHHIPLDPVYTGKMMFGIFDLLSHNYFRRGTKILALHTGGLQGRLGFNF